MNIKIKRQIVLDTETTGINKSSVYYEGHRIIEIGAVEIINRRLSGRRFHVYLKPDRLIEPEAFNIHGISDEFLIDKPNFADVSSEFLKFIHDSELIIHNASFDAGFLDQELKIINHNITKIDTFCKITDSLSLARKIFPGKRNSLEALCNHYLINISNKRVLHGALLDAELLAEVFLLMTSSQTNMYSILEENKDQYELSNNLQINNLKNKKSSLKILYANKKESVAHEEILDLIQKDSGICLWRK